VLRLYIRDPGVASETAGVLGAVQQGPFKPAGASVGEAAAEDGDEVLASKRLRHEFPALAGFGVAGEGSFHQRGRVEFGFHGFHQVFGGVLGASQARLFFFDFADLAVDLVARGFGESVKEFLEAFGLAEFAGEDGMDGHSQILPLITLITRIFTDLLLLKAANSHETAFETSSILGIFQLTSQHISRFSERYACGTFAHMTRLPTRVLFLLLLTLPLFVYGQETVPVKGKISAAEILEKNLIATGGLEAHKALETLVASGDIHLDATLIGGYKFSYKAPDNDMLEIGMSSRGVTWTGHRGKKRGVQAASEGPGAKKPGEPCTWCVIDGVNTWIVESDWGILLRWDFCCSYNIELIGMGEVDKRLAYGLRFTSKHGGDPFVCFYDRETFLLVRLDRIDRFRTGPNQIETVHKVESIFRDYREQGGVKLPFVIAIPRREGDVVFEVNKIKTGEEIKDSVFE
jgi:hypothetical protein